MPSSKYYDPFVFKVNERNASRAERQGRLNKYIRSASSNFIKRPAVRKLILEKDHNKCVKCGSGEHLQIDHIIPVYRLGFDSNTIDNLQTLCRSCNSSKQ